MYIYILTALYADWFHPASDQRVDAKKRKEDLAQLPKGKAQIKLAGYFALAIVSQSSQYFASHRRKAQNIPWDNSSRPVHKPKSKMQRSLKVNWKSSDYPDMPMGLVLPLARLSAHLVGNIQSDHAVCCASKRSSFSSVPDGIFHIRSSSKSANRRFFTLFRNVD